MAELQDNHLLQRLHLNQDSDMALVVNAIMSEPAELELPMEIAYMSNLVSDADALRWPGSSGREVPRGSGTSGMFHQDKVAVVYFDRQGVKSTLIGSARTQSNVSVTDDEFRKNPKLAAAAILAELMRWISNFSFRRQARRHRTQRAQLQVRHDLEATAGRRTAHEMSVVRQRLSGQAAQRHGPI